MAFTPDTLSEILQTIGGTFHVFYYETEFTGDTQAEILAANYFLRARESGVQTGDLIAVHSAADGHYTLLVTSMSATGTATVVLEDAGTAVTDDEESITVTGKHIIKRFLGDSSAPMVEGEDTADWAANTPILQAAMAEAPYEIRPGAFFGVTSRIPVGYGIEGPRSATIKVSTATSFTNATVTGIIHQSNACVFDLSGLVSGALTRKERVHLCGFTILGDSTELRHTNVVVARNINELLIDGLEIANFCSGYGIRLDSILKGVIQNNDIHHFTTNSAGWALGVTPDIGAIIFDADILGGVSSAGLRLENNRLHDLAFGATARTAYGDQSDGIGGGRPASTGHMLRGNYINGVGEGMDLAASDTLIADNIILATTNFGVKLIHGPSRVSVKDNKIDFTGKAGIVVSGSDNVMTGVDKIVLRDNDISFVNYNSLWDATNPSCILMEDAGFTNSLITNAIVTSNICDATTGTGVRPIVVIGHASHSSEIFNNVEIYNPVLPQPFYSAAVGVIRHVPENPSIVRAERITSGVAIPDATFVQIIFNSKSEDPRSEYSTSTGFFTAKSSLMRLRVTFKARITDGTAGADITFQLRAYNAADVITSFRECDLGITDFNHFSWTEIITIPAIGGYIGIFGRNAGVATANLTATQTSILIEQF